jgi:hypothetical protein
MGVRSARRVAPEYKRVLTSVFEFMFACGLARKDILTIATVALDKAKVASGELRRDVPGGLATFRRKNDLVEIRRAGAPNMMDPPR